MLLPINYDDAQWAVRKQAREQYVYAQEGLCWLCKEPLDGQPSDKILKFKINRKLFPKRMFDNPIHLHHNRVSGLTIGAVHAICNAYLWQHKGE